MKPITCLADDEILMPYWLTDKQEIILKCKNKWIGYLYDLNPTKHYNIDVEFESFCVDKQDEEPVKGYYLKIPSMKAIDDKPIELEISDSN